jgi:hypothetical protein
MGILPAQAMVPCFCLQKHVWKAGRLKKPKPHPRRKGEETAKTCFCGQKHGTIGVGSLKRATGRLLAMMPLGLYNAAIWLRRHHDNDERAK